MNPGLLIRGDYLLVMDEANTVLEDAAVFVEGRLIVEVGPYRDLARKYPTAKTLGGSGRVVLPGFVNTHTHAAMVYLRGMADDMPLKQWLEENIWPAEGRWLSPEFIADAVGLACLEMLKAGITSFSDMYFFEDVAAEIIKSMGMRAVLGSGVVDFPTPTTKDADDCLGKAEKLIERWKGDGLITPALAPHSAYACSPETLRKVLRLAEKHDVAVHTHLSETEGEVEESRRKVGMAPVAFLDSLGFLGERLVAAHCVWVMDEEIDMLAKRKVKVSHCAESNLKLASGVAPVTRMLEAGVKVTIGTDGAASNNDLDMLSEISTVARLHKAVTRDPAVLDAPKVLRMATRDGAEALGMNAGALETGMAADVIIVDLNKPHLTPIYNICSHLVYAARSSDVETVVVDGRVLVEKGELLTASEPDILARAREWGARIANGVTD